MAATQPKQVVAYYLCATLVGSLQTKVPTDVGSTSFVPAMSAWKKRNTLDNHQ